VAQADCSDACNLCMSSHHRMSSSRSGLRRSNRARAKNDETTSGARAGPTISASDHLISAGSLHSQELPDSISWQTSLPTVGILPSHPVGTSLSHTPQNSLRQTSQSSQTSGNPQTSWCASSSTLHPEEADIPAFCRKS